MRVPRINSIPFFIIFSICLGHALLSVAQPKSYNFKKYTTADGLPHNVGFEMLQTPEGYIWIGTDNGLSRFDGFAFKNFNEKNGLKNPHVISLEEGADGEILVGTYGGGFQVLKNDSLLTLFLSSPERVIKIESFKDGSILIDRGKPGDSELYFKSADDSIFQKINFYFKEHSYAYFLSEKPTTYSRRGYVHAIKKKLGGFIDVK